MGNELKGRREHSAEHFGDTRDHWWNADFLRLLAERWRLHEARDVLDVGCGVGHWGALLAGLLPSDARLTGLDREAGWVAEARARAGARGLQGRARYAEGEVERLPFPDDTFDLTTCQTVLIHVADPAAALAEMARVTRPGGLVLAAEPNNLTESLLLDSVASEASTDDLVDLVRLQLTCERGKVALGEGDNSLGDRVPGLFAAQGLADIQVYVNDKATAVFPPYASPDQRAFAVEARDRAARRLWNWSEADARRLFLAGGGHPPSFADLFERALALRERSARALDAGTYHGVSGGLFYVVSGRKL
jgi:SAM-dependent methyltransferase